MSNGAYVELRSDTFTTPTPEMRRAMADAVVGDDEYGEDPSVNRLQSLAGAALGTEAALFTPSGTMANQIAIRVLSRPGTEVLCPARSHVYQYELAASPQNSGVQLHPLWDVPDGIVTAVEGTTHEFPPISMLTLENTYMAMSGAPTGAEEMRTLVGLGRAGGLRVHVDGARIWNAAIATGAAPSELTGGADTVMFCLSKGLGAPVGSLLCGPADVIAEARVQRRKLGGGMRQAGVIAAAGIVAIETMVERLADDHARARVLADALAQRWPESVDPASIRTNIVCARLDALPDGFIERLAAANVRVGTIDPRTVRLVTHKDVDDDDLARVISAFDGLRAG
jgi:threonine aldolase